MCLFDQSGVLIKFMEQLQLRNQRVLFIVLSDMSVALKAATDIFKFRKTGKIDIKQKFKSDFDLTGH